jgi:hypothetical protein
MRKEKRVPKSPGRVFFCEGGELAGDHFGVDLGDGAGDAEAPGEDGVSFKFIGDDVLVGGVGEGNARFVHFFGLQVEVVEEIAEISDAFLAADGAVTGDEESRRRRRLFDRGRGR